MADILISMNKTTEKLWKYADEWEKTPEHFDGVNPFCLAIHAVRQITNAPEILKEQEAAAPEVEVLNEIDRLYRCPKCHKCFFYEKQKYCDQCGQAVKWDG